MKCVSSVIIKPTRLKQALAWWQCVFRTVQFFSIIDKYLQNLSSIPITFYDLRRLSLIYSHFNRFQRFYAHKTRVFGEMRKY